MKTKRRVSRAWWRVEASPGGESPRSFSADVGAGVDLGRVFLIGPPDRAVRHSGARNVMGPGYFEARVNIVRKELDERDTAQIATR